MRWMVLFQAVLTTTIIYLVGNRNSRAVGNFVHIGDLKLEFSTPQGMTPGDIFDLR